MKCPECQSAKIGLFRRLGSSLIPITCPSCNRQLVPKERRWLAVFLGVIYVPLMPIALVVLMPPSELGFWLGVVLFVSGLLAIAFWSLATTELEASNRSEERAHDLGLRVGASLRRFFR
jgi:hypothetical protein